VGAGPLQPNTASKYSGEMRPLMALVIAPNRIPATIANGKTISGVHQRIWLPGGSCTRSRFYQRWARLAGALPQTPRFIALDPRIGYDCIAGQEDRATLRTSCYDSPIIRL